MKTFSETISRISALLMCALSLFISLTSESEAVVVPADSIRSAVLCALKRAAEREGLEIEAAVPYAINVLVKGMDDAVIRPVVPMDKISNRRVPVKVEFLGKDGKVARWVNIFAHIKSYATLAVTTVDLRRGDPIDRGSVIFKNIDVSGVKEYYDSFVDISNMQAKRSIRAGTILTAKNVEPVPIISRGDMVTIRANVGNIMVSTQGKAGQDGGLNESIRVYSETTKKTIIGTVIDKRTVLISDR
ncbi:flagellar basal body P-ring formation chaperone FlgA [Candidatus Latescibacterota bacterium]